MKSFLFAFCCLLFLLIQFPAHSQSKAGPNIVLIYMDDMGYGDLSMNGHPTIHTPNLDKLGSEGLVMTQFYSGSSACSASRYALLTGKYPARSGFNWVLFPDSPNGIKKEEITIAEMLKERGYTTGIFGKWHLGMANESYLPPANGFDTWDGFPYSNDMRPPRWPELPLYHNNRVVRTVDDQSEMSKLLTDSAISFIDKNQKRPFFAYIPYSMPHIPLYAEKTFKGTSSRGIYGDVIEEIDSHVGRIISFLKKSGIDQNTLVIFSSDNGPWIIQGVNGGSSGLFRDGKGSTWEGGIRVPGILWWPSVIPAGSRSEEVTSVIDLLPTFAYLTGNPVNHQIDGKPISALTGKVNDEQRVYFIYGLNNKLYAVRKGKWKLHVETYSQKGINYFDGKTPLLFDLESDPSEEFDLSETYPEIVEELKKLIENQK